jgi:threonine dehydrogenase-like Zn-dependent dehydrogenase
VKALVFTRQGVVELAEVEPPQLAADEVMLEVVLAGICGSELEGVSTPNQVRVPPLVMGHEVVGRRLDDGRLAAINPLLSCGRCDLCELGKTNLCRQRRLVGIHRPGGFAELVAVPASRCRPLPAGLDVDRAVLAEPIANAVHALRTAMSHLGGAPRSLGIIGAGMLGIGCALAAVERGIPEIAVSDLNDERLALVADTLGVRAAKRLEGEHNVVIDAVGLGATRAEAVERLRPGGVSVWIGLAQPDPGFDSLSLVRQERVVCGTFAYDDSEFDEALELCARADPRWVEQIPLAGAAERFGELLRAPGPIPRTAIQPGGR